ncbi:MAG: hypothetical protein PWQ68_1056 [Thermoanaerobacteraceae bacterium]|nr:hypothetical protein [Thermoanaerobacteraceae bacterium]
MTKNLKKKKRNNKSGIVKYDPPSTGRRRGDCFESFVKWISPESLSPLVLGHFWKKNMYGFPSTFKFSIEDYQRLVYA